uniref:Uncharacterized protein n=1 Tax=Anguilla anguilla TaxID=7936 RepID=A0A0E9U660_ANGAN
MRSVTHKMKSSVGPLLLLSLVAFVSVTFGQECLHLLQVSLPRPLQTSTRKARRQKLLDLQRWALCGQCRCLSPGDGSS